jgi:hypothetical protein
MKHQLILSFTDKHLTLEIQRSSGIPKLDGLLGKLFSLGKARTLAVPAIGIARADLTASITPDTLVSVLEQALTTLRTTYKAPLRQCSLEVHLGLAHVRLGLMVLTDPHTAAPAPSVCETYTKAWVREMWDIDPAHQVLRWQLLEDAQRVLISSVDRRIYDHLDGFTRKHGMRFVSCKPALLSTLKTYMQQVGSPTPSISKGMTLVWTEAAPNARRANNVQLLHYENAQIQSLWRGWLPPPTTIDGADGALNGAIRRFQAYCKIPIADTVQYYHWIVPSPNLAAH